MLRMTRLAAASRRPGRSLLAAVPLARRRAPATEGREASPEDVLAAAEEDPRRHQRASSSRCQHRRPARRRHRHRRRPTASPPTPRPSRARSRSLLSGITVDVPVVAVDGKVYAQLPLTPGWSGRSTRPTTAPPTRPSLMSPDDGLLLAARPRPTDVEEGEACAAAPTTARSSPATPAPSPATAVDERHPERRRGDFDATYTVTDDGELREADADRASSTRTPTPITYTVDFDDYGTDEGHHRAVTRRDRPAAAAARRWPPSRSRSRPPTPTSWCSRCRT